MRPLGAGSARGPFWPARDARRCAQGDFGRRSPAEAPCQHSRAWEAKRRGGGNYRVQVEGASCSLPFQVRQPHARPSSTIGLGKCVRPYASSITLPTVIKAGSQDGALVNEATSICAFFVRRSSLQTRSTRRWTSLARISTARRRRLCGPTAPRHQLTPTWTKRVRGGSFVAGQAHSRPGVCEQLQRRRPTRDPASFASDLETTSQSHARGPRAGGRTRGGGRRGGRGRGGYAAAGIEIKRDSCSSQARTKSQGLDDDCREEYGEGQGADLPDHRDFVPRLQLESKRSGAACAQQHIETSLQSFDDSCRHIASFARGRT